MIRRAEPCNAYVGNVCTGFGADATCMFCGWDRIEHPDAQARVAALFADGNDPPIGTANPATATVTEESP